MDFVCEFRVVASANDRYVRGAGGIREAQIEALK